MKSKNPFYGFAKEEISQLKRLKTPYKIQEFIETLGYNTGKRIAPINVLKLRKADCVEAAVFGSAVLLFHNIENFLIDLESVRDEDHVLCVYKLNGRYGSLAQSKFLGLKGRTPVYKKVRELVMSYFEHYFNFFGELTLRRYSVPVKMSKTDFSWLYEDKKMYELEKMLFKIRHFNILEKEKRLENVSKARFEKEIIIYPQGIRIGKAYKKP
jgi:hypothetical protein